MQEWAAVSSKARDADAHDGHLASRTGPLMRAWGSGTQPAHAHDALPLGDLWGVSGAIPFCAKKTVHRRHGVGGSPVKKQVRLR